MKRKILILFAHPAYEKSLVNRALADAVRDLPGVTFHDLYQAYPDLDIDVAHEQELLAAHDVIVMQHPFYWYSTPAMLKEWQDLVLQHGWAFGHEGTQLVGKTLITATTAGGGEDTYCRDGRNYCEMREFLYPLERTAALCGMRYTAPFVVHGTHSIREDQIAPHARDYRRFIEALVDGTLDLEAAARVGRLNADLDAVIRKPAGT